MMMLEKNNMEIAGVRSRCFDTVLRFPSIRVSEESTSMVAGCADVNGLKLYREIYSAGEAIACPPAQSSSSRQTFEGSRHGT
jgi:hypothetical protein